MIKEGTICVFGASSTWGAWDLEKGGWVNRLRLFFDATDYSIYVYNLGISGDTTDWLLERFEVEAEAREPTIIIFSIGDNDSAYSKSLNGPQVPLERFERNLEKLVLKAKKFTDRIVLLSCKQVDEKRTNPIPWNTDRYYTNQALCEYNQKIKEVAEKSNTLYSDIFDLLDESDLDDGLHPNAQGHQKIFLEVKGFLFENLGMEPWFVFQIKAESILFFSRATGSGIVHSEKGDFEISEGDLYFFEKGEIYWVEGNKLLLALVNAPKWTPEQHKIVD